MDYLKHKTKRASVILDKFINVGDEAEAKFQYQTLMEEHLELQKEFVSRKNKLQAAKQKKETILAEVRFLRRRRKYLSKRRVPEPDIRSNTVQGERNRSVLRAVMGNHDLNLVIKPSGGDTNVRKINELITNEVNSRKI